MTTLSLSSSGTSLFSSSKLKCIIPAATRFRTPERFYNQRFQANKSQKSFNSLDFDTVDFDNYLFDFRSLPKPAFLICSHWNRPKTLWIKYTFIELIINVLSIKHLSPIGKVRHLKMKFEILLISVLSVQCTYPVNLSEYLVSW